MKATKPEVRKRMVERTKLWRNAATGTEERRLAIRRANLSRYGITPEQYAQIHDIQSGLCAICGRPETEILRGEPRRLNIDHDHVRNFVRGLLCSGCNKGIGNLGESPERLQRAIDYLANATDAVQKLKGNA